GGGRPGAIGSVGSGGGGRGEKRGVNLPRRRGAKRKKSKPPIKVRNPPARGKNRQKRPLKSPPLNKWRSRRPGITFYSVAPFRRRTFHFEQSIEKDPFSPIQGRHSRLHRKQARQGRHP